jgi:hypothetical protein
LKPSSHLEILAIQDNVDQWRKCLLIYPWLRKAGGVEEECGS